MNSKRAKVIKRANSIISPILALHFNYLMKIGKFPDTLKTGKITPIYKKEDKEQLENYRPISTQSLVKYLKNSFIKDFLPFFSPKFTA